MIAVSFEGALHVWSVLQCRREAKRHAGGKREPIVVSGGLPGFKIAKGAVLS